MKKNLTVLLIVVLMSTMLFGCESSDSNSNTTTETDSDGKIYTNDFDAETNQKITLDEIEFEVPENWTDTNSSSGMIFEPEGGQLYVVSEKGPYDFSSEEKQDAFIDTYKNVEDFSETGRETISVLDDISALYFTYTCVLQDKPSKCYQIQFSTDTLVYGFLYADYDESEYNRSKDFDKVIDSITWAKEEEDNTEPVEDFFSDEERQNEYETLYTSYQFSELYDYVKQYIDNGGDSILESDSAYIILDLVEPIMEYEDTWTVNYDDFDGAYSLEFDGANQISDSESVKIFLSGDTYNQTIGFRKNGWLFFDKYALSIDGEVVDDNSVKSTSRDEEVISGNTIEESYSSAHIFDDDVCEQLKDSDTAILRFTNSDTNENYDHTLSKEEINAIYVSNLISGDWVEFENLLFDYVNGYEYVPH